MENGGVAHHAGRCRNGLCAVCRCRCRVGRRADGQGSLLGPGRGFARLPRLAPAVYKTNRSLVFLPLVPFSRAGCCPGIVHMRPAVFGHLPQPGAAVVPRQRYGEATACPSSRQTSAASRSTPVANEPFLRTSMTLGARKSQRIRPFLGDAWCGLVGSRRHCQWSALCPGASVDLYLCDQAAAWLYGSGPSSLGCMHGAAMADIEVGCRERSAKSRPRSTEEDLA